MISKLNSLNRLSSLPINILIEVEIKKLEKIKVRAVKENEINLIILNISNVEKLVNKVKIFSSSKIILEDLRDTKDYLLQYSENI